MKTIPAHPALVRQYIDEAQSWNRLLQFFKDELVFYKNRLTDFVAGDLDGEALLQAESFQEEFLSQDRIMDYLTTELGHQVKLLELETCLGGAPSKMAETGQRQLRHEISRAQVLFSDVKERYTNYLGANHFSLLN